MLLNYHIGRFVLVSLCVGDLVRLGLRSIRVAGWSLQHGCYWNPAVPNLQHTTNWEPCITDTTETQPYEISNTKRTENKTTDVVIHQHSRKLLMMDILISETCRVHKKWNKIASDIKLVFYSSNITMMHGPINIRYNWIIWNTANFR